MMLMGGGRPGAHGGGGRPGGPMGAMFKGDSARDFRGTMRKLIQYLGRHRAAVLIVFVFAVVSTAANIAGPKLLGQATTELFEGVLAQLGGTGGIDFDAIGQIVLQVLALYLASALFAYIQGWIMANVSTDITYRLRRDLSEKINRLPLRYYDGTTHGEVLSRITNDVDTINQTLSQSLTQIITSAVTVVGVLVMMLSINWVMTLVALLMIPLSMVVVGLIVGQSQKFFKQQQDYLGHVNGHVEEMYGGHVVMKAFNGEAESIAKFDISNNQLYASAWMSQFLSGLLMPLTMFIGNLGYVAIAILGGWLAVQGAITVGDIQAFIQYVRSFTQPITQLANISNILQQTAAAAERVFEFLAVEEEIPDPAEPVQLAEPAGHVEFRDVHFGYSPDKIVINDFSAVAHPGQKVAIVGPTGAGKTTMVKLLGAILVDGHDLRDFTRRDLRQLFGMVLQDTWLYNDTILENIRYGRPGATDAEVIAAAQAAHVDHFVHTLPDGYHMILNEEATNISQGQMQLLTIARAVLADPRILILDEATSSVDTRTEILIQRAMDNLMNDKRRTSFVIAHRLSTIRDADLILVMNHGDVIEQGTHAELLAAGGVYAGLVASPMSATLRL